MPLTCHYTNVYKYRHDTKLTSLKYKPSKHSTQTIGQKSHLVSEIQHKFYKVIVV